MVITSGLHLDRLADIVDAYFSSRNREKMLEIMRDSRLGAMGALALIIVLLRKYITFFLIKLLKKNSKEYYNYFLKFRILIRDCSSFNGLGNNFIKVSVGKKDEIDRFIEVLRGIAYE